MLQLHFRQILIIVTLGLLGWALCGAIMFIGMSLMSIQKTLIVHAIGAPVIFSLITLLYFRKFQFTSPIQTAAIFILIVMLMDFFLVALVINRSMEMFQSLLGTWIPFGLIFLSTYFTGLIVETKVKWRIKPRLRSSKGITIYRLSTPRFGRVPLSIDLL